MGWTGLLVGICLLGRIISTSATIDWNGYLGYWKFNKKGLLFLSNNMSDNTLTTFSLVFTLVGIWLFR